MLCSWNWKAITFWKRHLLSTQWVCRGVLSHTYFPSMVAVHFSSSQVAILPFRASSTNSNTTLQKVFVLKKQKGQNALTNFNLVSKIRQQSLLSFCEICCVINWICQRGSIPTPFPLQELSSGADRPLPGSRGGQSPGCLVQTKASHIALLCLLTSWLCHQVL